MVTRVTHVSQAKELSTCNTTFNNGDPNCTQIPQAPMDAAKLTVVQAKCHSKSVMVSMFLYIMPGE